MNRVKLPGFAAETSFSGFSGKFSMATPVETALVDQTVTMAQTQCCPRNNHCPAPCVEDISTQCTQAYQRAYDPWYTRCQDAKKYVTTGDVLPVGGDYWCGYWGTPQYAHYSPCY